MWTQLFRTDSFCEDGTLKQVANLPLKVKRDLSAARDILRVMVDGHIVAVAMKFFGLKCVTDTPANKEYLDSLNEAIDEQKTEYLIQCVNTMVLLPVPPVYLEPCSAHCPHVICAYLQYTHR